MIDAHLHLWNYRPEEYSWIDHTMCAIQRDFLPADFAMAIAGTGIDGAVVVQARQTLEETRWLLHLAEDSEMIRGVVGWAPLAAVGFASSMEEFSGSKKLRGLRHIVQSEPDGYMLASQFNANIASLEQFELVYDILVHERQLKEVIEFVDRHPRQVFVLNHIAKPRIAGGILGPWAENIRELARRDNIWCKVSGLVTEARWESWTPAQLTPYLDVVVEAFTPARLMAGSDWPVCLLASTYSRWFAMLKEYFKLFGEGEQEAIFGKTTIKVYGLAG